MPSRQSRSRNRPHRYSEPPSSHKGTVRLGFVILVLVGINLYVFLWRGGTSIPDVMEQAAVAGKDAPVEPELVGDFAPNAPRVIQSRVATGEVNSGDSMGRILRDQGLSATEADELIRALSGTMDLRKIRPGQKFQIRFDENNRVIEFDFVVSRTETVHVERGADGELSASTSQKTR